MKSSIESVEELLKRELIIPSYQRPYKWTRKNVADLLGDIDVATSEYNRHGHQGYKYRVGTIILHQEKGAKGFNIVDGQQRIVTLALLKRELDGSQPPVLDAEVTDPAAINNIKDNLQFLHEWVAANGGKREEYARAFSELLEVVVLVVDNEAEAFQLFDSQNTRGKELDPHDLLKAYHLREMDDYQFEKMNLIRRWEEIAPSKIRELFGLYLFPILNWSKREPTKDFTVQDIDKFKGVDRKSSFTYAQRVTKAMPLFQIDQPFCAGADFFTMVSHYIELVENVKREVNNIPGISDIISGNRRATRKGGEKFSSKGFGYALRLFYCAAIYYYDRFHNLDEMVVKKLFVWAMMIRVDMKYLGFDTINKYTIGDVSDESRYTNHLPMLFLIASARNDGEIKNLRVDLGSGLDAQKDEARYDLFKVLSGLMGVKDEK